LSLFIAFKRKYEEENRMAKTLTAGALNGTAYKEKMTVEWQGEQYEVEIRPLNNKEATEVEAAMQEGLEIKGEPGRAKQTTMTFDAKAAFIGKKKSDILAVAFGTTDASITAEVAEKEFPPQIIEAIATRVKELSGIKGAATEGEPFRGN
jgi:hypothetical protein